MGDGTHLNANAGDCIYVPKHSVYIIRCNQTQRFVHMTVNFELQDQGDLFETPTRRKLSGSMHFKQLFARLVHHWTVRHPYYHERCTAILYEMLYLILKEMKSSGSPYLEKLRPARLYLDEHFREDFPLDILPRLCGLSETYFRRLFHCVFNERPAEYRRRLRISCAENLLLSGQYTIAQIAQQCGYDDPAYFSRMFRKTLGVTPSRYVAEQLTRQN